MATTQSESKTSSSTAAVAAAPLSNINTNDALLSSSTYAVVPNVQRPTVAMNSVDSVINLSEPDSTSYSSNNYITLQLPTSVDAAVCRLFREPYYDATKSTSLTGVVTYNNDYACTLSKLSTVVPNGTTSYTTSEFLSDYMVRGVFSTAPRIDYKTQYRLDTPAILTQATCKVHYSVPQSKTNLSSSLLLQTAAQLVPTNALNLNNIGMIKDSRYQVQLNYLSRMAAFKNMNSNVPRLIHILTNLAQLDDQAIFNTANYQTAWLSAKSAMTPIQINTTRVSGADLEVIAIRLRDLDEYGPRLGNDVIFVPWRSSDFSTTSIDVRARVLSYVGDYRTIHYINAAQIGFLTDNDTTDGPPANTVLYSPFASCLSFNNAVTKVVLVDLDDTAITNVTIGTVVINVAPASFTYVSFANAFSIANYSIANRRLSYVAELKSIVRNMSAREVVETMMYTAELTTKLSCTSNGFINYLNNQYKMVAGHAHNVGSVYATAHQWCDVAVTADCSAIALTDCPEVLQYFNFQGANESMSPFGRPNCTWVTTETGALNWTSAQLLATYSESCQAMVTSITIPQYTPATWFLLDTNMLQAASHDGSTLMQVFAGNLYRTWSFTAAVGALMTPVGANMCVKYSITYGSLHDGVVSANDGQLPLSLLNDEVPINLGSTHFIRYMSPHSSDTDYVQGANFRLPITNHIADFAQANFEGINTQFYGVDLHVCAMRVPYYVIVAISGLDTLDLLKRNINGTRLMHQGSVWCLYDNSTGDKPLKNGPFYIDPARNIAGILTTFNSGAILMYNHPDLTDTLKYLSGSPFVKNAIANASDGSMPQCSLMYNHTVELCQSDAFAWYTPAIMRPTYFKFTDPSVIMCDGAYSMVLHLGHYDVGANADGYGYRMYKDIPDPFHAIAQP